MTIHVERPETSPHPQEAAESAGPLRLMRLFGITEQTTMRYITAAH
ncbi:hypothetical protein ACFY74_36505 [Streptomyces massasporeus]